MARCEVIQNIYRYLHITYHIAHMYSNLNILLYHSNVRNKIDKKNDYEFKDFLRYYK